MAKLDMMDLSTEERVKYLNLVADLLNSEKKGREHSSKMDSISEGMGGFAKYSVAAAFGASGIYHSLKAPKIEAEIKDHIEHVLRMHGRKKVRKSSFPHWRSSFKPKL